MRNKLILIITSYFVLLLLCTTLLIVSNFLNPQLHEVVMAIAAGGFKLVLGALIGALSAMLGST